MVIRLIEDVFLQLVQLVYEVVLVVLLEHDEEVGLWVDLNLAWGVPCLEYMLGELLSDVLN